MSKKELYLGAAGYKILDFNEKEATTCHIFSTDFKAVQFKVPDRNIIILADVKEFKEVKE